MINRLDASTQLIPLIENDEKKSIYGDNKNNYFSNEIIKNNKNKLFLFGGATYHMKNRSAGGGGQAKSTNANLNVIPIITATRLGNSTFEKDKDKTNLYNQVVIYHDELKGYIIDYYKGGGKIIFPVKINDKNNYEINIGTGLAQEDPLSVPGQKFATDLLIELYEITNKKNDDKRMEKFENNMNILNIKMFFRLYNKQIGRYTSLINQFHKITSLKKLYFTIIRNDFTDIKKKNKESIVQFGLKIIKRKEIKENFIKILIDYKQQIILGVNISLNNFRNELIKIVKTLKKYKIKYRFTDTNLVGGNPSLISKKDEDIKEIDNLLKKLRLIKKNDVDDLIDYYINFKNNLKNNSDIQEVDKLLDKLYAIDSKNKKVEQTIEYYTNLKNKLQNDDIY